jgi:hypothetical protein
VSNAKPMTAGARLFAYALSDMRRHRTPRQWRRIRHKYNRAHGLYLGHWGEACKGLPTPRRRRPA